MNSDNEDTLEAYDQSALETSFDSFANPANLEEKYFPDEQNPSKLLVSDIIY